MRFRNPARRARGRLLAALATALLVVHAPSLAAEGVEALAFAETRPERQGIAGAARVIEFPFVFTNLSARAVVVRSVRAACGCTVARLPELPWTVEAGAVGAFSVALDTEGRRGTISKSLWLNTSIGVKPLKVRAVLRVDPVGLAAAEARERNLQVAIADPGALFRGACADCHATPASGLRGEELYDAVCGICHDARARSPLVPALAEGGKDRAYWIRWITDGLEGSLMPGFAAWRGGPLDGAQVESLADHLMSRPAPPGSSGAVVGTDKGGDR